MAQKTGDHNKIHRNKQKNVVFPSTSVILFNFAALLDNCAKIHWQVIILPDRENEKNEKKRKDIQRNTGVRPCWDGLPFYAAFRR